MPSRTRPGDQEGTGERGVRAVTPEAPTSPGTTPGWPQITALPCPLPDTNSHNLNQKNLDWFSLFFCPVCLFVSILVVLLVL